MRSPRTRGIARPSNRSSADPQNPVSTAFFAPVISPAGANSLQHKGFFSTNVCVCWSKGIRCAQNGPRWANLTFGRKTVNKAELIEALAARLGDRKTATAALDAVISEVQNAV